MQQRGEEDVAGDGEVDRRCCCNDQCWLLHPDWSKRVILGASRMLNNAALNGVGTALLHPVVAEHSLTL